MACRAQLSAPNHKTQWVRFLVSLLATFATPGLVWAAGLDPVPTFVSADIQVQVHRETLLLPPPFSGTFNRYVYNYSVANPDTNNGEIWYWKVDISEPRRTSDSLSPDLTLPKGMVTLDFEGYRDRIEPFFLPPSASVVPIGQTVPPGWLGGFGRDGFLGFASGNDTPNILPGETRDGFQIRARRLPSVRGVEIIADWVLVVEDHDTVTEEELDQAAAVEESLRFKTFTLGPSPSFQVGNFQHFNRLADEISKMVEIGWIDTAMGAGLLLQLNEARDAFQSGQGTEAKTLLQTLFEAAASLRSEAQQLLQLNIEALSERIPDTPEPFVPPEPVLTLTPKTVALSVGTVHTIVLKIVNAADNDRPFTGFENFCGCDLRFVIAEGPHRGQFFSDVNLNANGEASFSYAGAKQGVDTIRLLALFGTEGQDILDEAKVRWEGGPDLAVPAFIPPSIETEAGKIVFVSDRTMNLGNLPAAPSITRYFLSSVEPVDPANSLVIGQRAVAALEPNEFTDGLGQEFIVPAGLAPGVYFMAACADAEQAVTELNESNNCSFSELETIATIIVPGAPPSNNPPNCSRASANPMLLWPPNHKLVAIGITGITDPEGEPIAITITSIQQDEPLNGLGDGDTSPDGIGIGTSQASVRRERSGRGDGRIYEIGFEGHDNQGASCTGKVSVGVPHDRGKGSTPIDSGVRFDSTQP